MRCEAQLKEIAKGDRQAFNALYRERHRPLLCLATGLLAGDASAAEDIVNEAFCAIWTQAGHFSGAGSAEGWIRRIVRNKAFDVLRASDHTVEIDGNDFDAAVLRALEDPGATPVEALQMSRDAQALALCMSELDSVHRQVVGMAFFHDLSHSELAQQLALPIGTVKTWIRRSLERLRTCLGKQERA